MSEKLTLDHESYEGLLKTPEHLALPDAEHAEPLRSGEKDPRLTLQEARQEIREIDSDNSANVAREQLAGAEKAPDNASSTYINTELKQITLRRELQSIRRQLSAPQRTLSKVIHQPVVRAVSEAAGQTVSRPSGLLGGGLVALVGTSGYLYLAKHIGFRYNYLVFLLLLAGGFVLGLLLELLVHLATARRHKINN